MLPTDTGRSPMQPSGSECMDPTLDNPPIAGHVRSPGEKRQGDLLSRGLIAHPRVGCCYSIHKEIDAASHRQPGFPYLGAPLNNAGTEGGLWDCLSAKHTPLPTQGV